jgi:hypothetical protein
MGAPFNQNTFSLSFALSNINGAFNERTVTTGGNILATDNIVYVNNTSTAAMALALPGTPAVGQFLIIKDITGNAATYNITVTGTVDGVTNPVIGANYGGVGLFWTGSKWTEVF